MSITSITRSVENVFAKSCSYIANNKFLSKHVYDRFENNFETATAIASITSIVVKDGFGCYLYVKQSLNNEKIPEEKRAFVAALDLTNGGLMILAQLLAFFTINNPKVQDKLFGKFFNKIFSEKNRDRANSYIRSKLAFKDLSKDAVNKQFDKLRDSTKSTFGFLTSLIGATMLAKRVIVPFIATPLASYAKDKMMAKGKKPQTDKVEISNNNEKDSVDNNPKIKVPSAKGTTNLLVRFTSQK